MPIGTRAKLASTAVALVVMVVIGTPAFAIVDSTPDSVDVHALAKPTQKPKPSHPHATPTPAPTATPRPTAAPTPRATPKPVATRVPDATPRRTDRQKKDDRNGKSSKRRADASPTGETPTSTPGGLGGGLRPPGAGTTGRSGPSPELLGIATLLAALVGLGTVRLLFGRSRRNAGAPPAPVAARIHATQAPNEAWTNVRLDDTEALPEWLRLDAEPERAQLAHIPAISPITPFNAPEHRSPMPADTPPTSLEPDRGPQRFSEPVGDGAMRLAVGPRGSELLDHPSDEAGAVLATLVAGDEVEVQDVEEPWLLVATPLGATGWIRSESLALDAPAANQGGSAGTAPAAQLPLSAPRHGGKRRGPRVQRRSRSAEQPS